MPQFCETDINEHLITLNMLTKELRLHNVLELGVRNGDSTIALLSAVRELNGLLTSIDIDDCPVAKEKVDTLGLSQWWRFIRGDDMGVEWNEHIDHLFIDTNHFYEHTLKELQKYEPYVKVGGIITLHDIITYPDVLRAVEKYLLDRNDLTLYQYENDNGLAVIWKKI